MYKEERDKKILEYLPLVKAIAGKIYKNLPPSVDYNDLVSYGIIGLIDAIDHLDKTKNPQSYIKIRIRGSIIDYLRSLDFGSRSIREKEHKIREALRVFEDEHQREPTDEEISAILGESLEEYHDFLYKISFSYMLNLEDIAFRITEDADSSYENFVASDIDTPEENTAKLDLVGKLKDAIDQLDYREKLVLQLIFYEELSIKDVAKVLNTSLSRVSQIKSQALSKVREYLGELV